MFSRATRAFSVNIISKPWLWACFELSVSELVGSLENMEHLWNSNWQKQTEVVEEEPFALLLVLHANLMLTMCLETGDPWWKEKNWGNIAYYLSFWHCIQGDSGGNVNVLGDDSISHCDKKSSYRHVSNSELDTEVELFDSTNAKALWLVIKKDNFSLIAAYTPTPWSNK